MKIAESGIALDASHQSVEFHHRSERLEIWQGSRRRVMEADSDNASPGRSLMLTAERLSLSAEASSLQIRSGEVALDNEQTEMDANARFEVSLLKLLVEQITGRRIRVIDPADLKPKDTDQAPAGDRSDSRDRPTASEGNGFGLRYEYHEVRHESEQTRFHAQGVARTEDGREIRFDVQLNMSREFTEQTHLEIRAGEALKDPLVLNFEGNAAQLTQRDFRFDLDVDGSEDQIAFVGSGSGFLALDRNNDGTINDGSELFGPTTGDGFAELAAHDSDNNNWIDENDPIYARLRIWSRDAAGNQQLLGLGASNVGAIYLGKVATPFSLNDSSNEQLGQVRSSGVFLKESGEVATIQQLDLVV